MIINENNFKNGDILIFNGVKFVSITVDEILSATHDEIQELKNNNEIMAQRLVDIQRQQNDFIDKLKRAYGGRK